MAAAEKKPIKGELKAYALKEMGKPVRDFITKNPVLAKKFGAPIGHSETVELDPRKWKKKTLDDGLYAVARYELKLLAVRAAKIIKDNEKNKSGDTKKIEKELCKEFDEISKEIKDKVSLALEELASDKGDNKKGLKDCKAAFAKLDSFDLDLMYSVPRQRTLQAFELLARALSAKGEPSKKVTDKAKVDAISDVNEAIDEFKKFGKEAANAIDTLLQAAKTTAANKDVDPEFAVFAKSILDKEKKFASVLDGEKTFSKALDEALKNLKSGSITDIDAKVQVSVFTKLASLDGSADEALSYAKKLKPAFKKIEAKLK